MPKLNEADKNVGIDCDSRASFIARAQLHDVSVHPSDIDVLVGVKGYLNSIP